MTRQQLAAEVFRVSHRTGTFRLRSGVQSDEYFDKYRFEASPPLLAAICAAMVPLIPSETDVLAGLELGGVPIATVLGQLTGLPLAFVRKAAKDYGTCQLAEGESIAGRHVLVVEDVVTSGGQVIQSSRDLRGLGAIVEHAVCVIDRQSTGRDALAAANVNLLSLFTYAELVTP